MRRIQNLVAKGSRKVQAVMGEQSAARGRARRMMQQLFMDLSPLEERVLMTAITINSQADLAQYFNSLTNSYTIDAEKEIVTIAPNIVINTSSATGQAGNITISGQSVTIGSNVQILANGATEAQDGSITITASNVMEGFNINAVNQAEDFVRWFQNQSATIVVGQGVAIQGGAVNISSESGNGFKQSWISNLVIQPFSAILLEAFHKPDFFSLPVTVQVWQPQSTISFAAGSEINSSGSVTVTSDAQVNAVGKAIWNTLNYGSHFGNGHFADGNYNPLASTAGRLGLALGDFYTDANATITLSSDATINAAGEVEMKTTVDNVVELESEAIKNLGITQTNPNAISLAFGFTQLKTNSVIDLQANSQIEAEGIVNIEAEATDENEVAGMASAYRDGTFSAGGAFAYSNANVQVFVNGTVTSGVVPTHHDDLPPVLFNPAFTANFNNNSLDFGNPVKYTTGQELIFDSADGSTIPGLKPGSSYFAIVNSAYPNRLQLAATKSDALAGTPIRFGTAYPTLSTGSSTLPISVIDSSVSNAILFGYNTLPDGSPVFTNGQTVTFSPLDGQLIGTSDSNGNYAGPLASGQYTVKIVASPEPDYFPLAVQLYDLNNNLVILNTNSQFTTANGTVYQVASFDSSTSQIDFNFTQPPTSDNGPAFLPVPSQNVNLTNGQPITFTSGLGCQVNNVINGQTYYAVVDPSTPGVIRLATTYAQSIAANPAVQDAIPQLKTVDKQPCIGSFSDSFTKSGQASVLLPQTDNSYTLYNNATGGTFQLTADGPDGSATTLPLAYNASAAELQSALNAISGIAATVSGQGTQASPWQISILFQFNIGNVQPGLGLVFSNNPNLPDGAAVTYLGIAGKPVGGLTDGETYYAYNTTNPDFDSEFPQYVLNLKESAGTSSPDIELALQQSMTDANGLNYSFVASNAAENQVVLQLTQTALVNNVNGALLTGGLASFQALPAGGVQFFSFATSGTFTFSLTDSSGNVQTTASIDYNATSATVSDALNALDGVNVQVTGQGTISSPWSIVGLLNQGISDDSSNLKNDGFATSLLSCELGGDVQQVWTNATGGTFTISLENNGQIWTTAPIAYNADAQEVEDAINALPRVRATVIGSGTENDPWQFTAVYQSIATGDALAFNDCWNSYNNGMVNGQSYYAVVSADQYNPQAVVISLAASYADAVASTPVLINMQDYLLLTINQTGVMTGAQMGLDEVHGEEGGVSIKAVLEASDSVTFTSSVGLFPMLGYYTAGAWAGHHSYQNPDGSYISAIEKHIEEKLPNEETELTDLFGNSLGFLKREDKIDVTHPLQSSLAFALLVSKNNVNVNIGSTAVIETTGRVSIASEINHVLHTQADAGVARTTLSKLDTGALKPNAALAVGLNLAFVDNTSMAVIQPNAEVTGGEGVIIDSAVSYPFAWKETNISTLLNANGTLTKKQKSADGTTITENIVKDALFKNAFGVSNWLFNHSVNTDIMQPDNSVLDWTLSASVSSLNIKNTNLAQICDGALINQNPNVHSGANQSVSVKADTDISQISVTGQMVLGLNLGWLAYASKTKGGVKENYNYMLFLNQGKNAIGGSINVASMDNTTQALIGGESPPLFTKMTENQSQSPTGPTEVNFGNGGLTVEAATINEYISIAQSGGIASGFGFQASIAVTDIGVQNTTAAIMAATQPPVIQNNPGTNGNLTITSDDTTVLTPSSGGLLIGKSINLGFSSAEAKLNRNVSAYIGESDPNSNVDQSAWVGVDCAGEIVIDACATGKIIPVSLAGSVVTRPSDANGVETELKGEEFRWGIGVSGDYSEANIVDNVSAFINGATLSGHENEQLLEIAGLNSTRLNIATGAAALQFEGSQRSSVGFAGSASYSNYLSNVTVLLNNANITAFSVSLDAQNQKTMGTFAAGLSGSVVGKTGIDVAGSVAINHVTNDTVAEIVGISGCDIGSVAVTAFDIDEIWAAAGTITFVTSLGSGIANPDNITTKVGFGFGFAQNLLDSSTHAIISDSELEQTAGDLSLAAEQASRSFVLSAGTVFEAGKGMGITPYGMVALNQYTNADVQALVENSSITSSSSNLSAGMLIASQLIPIMVTVAGDLGLSIAYKTGVGAETSLGAGVSVTEVSITGNSVASVSNSTITLDQGNLTVNAYTGQAANATNLNNTLTNLNLPPGDYNLFSLAIAGGLTTAIAPAGEYAVGLDGVGAGIGSTTTINTLANIKNGSNITLLGKSQSGSSLSVSAQENLTVYDDAGGASISIQYSPEMSFGVAIGIGAGLHNSTDQTIADISSSAISISGNLTVSADNSSFVKVIGFGVALDVSIADATGAGLSASSATAKIVSENVISANVVGNSSTVNGAVQVTATDDATLQAGVGSGSLAIAGGSAAGVALAAGASESRVDASDQISAYIGSTDSNSTLQTIVTSSGTVLVKAVNAQNITTETIAVAASGAGGEGFSISVAGSGATARIVTDNNITANIGFGALVASKIGVGNSGVKVQAIDQSDLTSTVGSGALAITGSEIPIGLSIGVSISEITNNDNTQAVIQGACVTTSGGDVSVEATGNNTHFSKSVATSGSDLGSLAGAGGNSNIYDNANFTASVDSGSSIGTGNNATGFGSLTVLANTAETVMAQMFGGAGDLGIGSIGVFMSNATRSGSTVANLVTNGNISVGNLTVKATTNQTITSEGMSVTVGFLAGSGETHRLYINENVHTNADGSSNTWYVHGNLTIGAASTNNATAQTSGAKSDQQDVNVAGLGVGEFAVYSYINPVVSTSVNNTSLVVDGTSSMGSIAITENDATARSGSGSVIGVNAAMANTKTSPTIELSTSNLILNSGTATFLARNCITYSTTANSVYASGMGFSDAVACNTAAPNLTLNLGSGTSITANGSVIVKSENDITGLGDGSNMNGNSGGIMVRMGSGSIAGGAWGNAVSCLTASSAIRLGDGVSVVTNAQGGRILIGSSQGWNTNQLTYMHDSSGFGGGNVRSLLTSCLTNNISLGENVILTAPTGSIGIGTSINSQTTADTYSYVFEVGGSSKSYANNSQRACQSVSIGNNSLLRAGGDISVTAGQDPVTGGTTLQDTFAIITAKANGGVVFTTEACATSNSNMNVMLGNGSQIISGHDVDLGAIQGINDAACYTFSQKNWRDGNTNSGTSGATQNSNVSINGNVVAGYAHELNIEIPQTGNLATVNGQPVSLPSNTLTNVVPNPDSSFLPFQAIYNSNYSATGLLNGLDPTSKAILEKSISSSPVPAITLANLAAAGGQVLIYANTTLAGTGTISAFSPNITVNNNRPAYLILDGIGIPNTLNMGKITVVGNAGVPLGMKLNQQSANPSVTINQNYNAPVGSGTTSGPAIAITAPIVNTGGSVVIYNACGALVQEAPINAKDVGISTPNSAYIVDTPKNYYGAGGSIADYWMNTATNLVQNSGFEIPSVGSGQFQYNPTGASWAFVGSTGISGNKSGFTSSNANAPAGSQVAFLQEKGVISQVIGGVVAGQQYQFSFSAAQRSGYPNQSFNVTLGNQSLVNSLTPSSTSYQNYSYTFTAQSSGNLTLTFTGLEPSGQDETVFLDQVNISPSPAVVTPGLNSYVYQYTANLAATTAADLLYYQQYLDSGAPSSGTGYSNNFSSWLYNTRNLGVGNSDWVNTNVSAGNPGSQYPSNTNGKDNWGDQEFGTGVIFFGSEIPYLWQNGSATIASGSSYLTSSLGYLDTLANAQYWSVEASGNPANSNLNVTQGTGPQNDNVSPGRGIYPVVPNSFLTSASISSPQNVTLGSGITAGQLDVTALYIDINAPINLGVNNSGFQANLTPALGTYIQSQVAGNVSLACVPIPASYLGGSNTSLSAYYDVQANQIVLAPIDINAGMVTGIFNGGIISSTNQGKISVTSNPGQNLIDNQSGYPLVVQGITSAESNLAGIVQFNDTLTNLSTAYIYRGNNQVDTYQGTLGANLNQLQLMPTTSGTNASFSPAANLAYVWDQAAYISRDLAFTNNNNAYTLKGSSSVVATGTVNDNWSWGPLYSNGDAPSNYTRSVNPFQPVAVPVNLVASGSFETPFNTTAAPGNYQYNPSGTGWTFSAQASGSAPSGSGLAGNLSSFTYLNPSAPQGKQVAFLQGKGTISQTISGLVAGKSYNLTFMAAQRAGYFSASQYQTFDISLGNQSLATSVKPEWTSFNQFTYNFTCNTNDSQTLTFTGLQPTSQDETVFLDAVVISENQPDSSTSQGSVVTLSSPISNYTQQFSALITQSETATTYFDSSYQSAWNFGANTQWTWMYPTEILLTIKNQLPACNPIAIDFSGVQFGSLGINSSSDLALDGNIQFPGQVSLNSGGSISQASGASISAVQLTSLTACGAIGNATSSLNLKIGSGPINAQAGTGLNLSSSESLTIGQLTVANGPVKILSGGSIVASGTSTNVSGTDISLLAPSGSIGSQSQPVMIQTQAIPLATGSVTGGLFTATATDAVFVSQVAGDLRIASVTTTSPVGVVSISAESGNITDGNIPDAFLMNNGRLSQALIGQAIDSIRLSSENNINLTIAAFEGSVDASYLQYWTALQNGSVANGSLTLTANGVNYYQANANSYYANTANQTSNATVAQVNSYANMLYNNAVSVFENSMAYGPGWYSQPEFQAYNANYTFTASNATISALTYRAADFGNAFALLSLDALSPQGSEILGNTTAPAIKTAVLQLNAGGSIGLAFDPIEIDLSSIQSGNLTAYEKTLLSLATNAGELMMVGTNEADQKIYYSYGSEPANVSTTGVVVRIEKPLFVDVANNGLTMLQANGSINLSGTSGNLNVLGASSNNNIRIASQDGITQGQLQASTATQGWSLGDDNTLGYTTDAGNWTGSELKLGSNPPAVVAATGNLHLISGDEIGTVNSPIQIQAGQSLSTFGTGDISLNQPIGNLVLANVEAGGSVMINAGGSIFNTENAMKGTTSGFGGNGVGWTTNADSNSTVAINNNILTLGNSASSTPQASSAWMDEPSTVVNGFVVSFIYQAQGKENGLTFTLQNDSRLTGAIGDAGPALGYGTTGTTLQIQPSLAWQLNIGADPNATTGIGLNRNGNYGIYQQPGTFNLNTSHPIQVVLTYSPGSLTFSQTLTDTVTGDTFSSSFTDINLLKLLGSPKALIGFTGSGPVQSVSDFYFCYGAPTIKSENLVLSSGGQIGTSSSPILMLTSGMVNATAPGGIYLLQTNGDLYVNSISSQADVALSAPSGSVVNNANGSVQSSSLMVSRHSANEIQQASMVTAGGIQADHLQVNVLKQIGTSTNPLLISVTSISACNTLGNIVIDNAGMLQIGDGSPQTGIQSGGAIQISGDLSINVNSPVLAAGDITLRTTGNYLAGSRIHVGAGSTIASDFGGVYLSAGAGVFIESGASVQSNAANGNSVVELSVNPVASGEAISPSIESYGQIVADTIRLNSSDIGTSFYLALNGFLGKYLVPTIQIGAGSGYDTLTIDNRDDRFGQAVTIADSTIQTANQKMLLNALDSVILELCDGNDQVKVGENITLDQLHIYAQGGDDSIETTLGNSTFTHQLIDGGFGIDSIKIDCDGQGTWASSGLVQSWQKSIQHVSTERISLNFATTLNAMPATGTPSTPTGLGSNLRFIEAAFQQILGRPASVSELNRWSVMLDRNKITRLQLANKLTNSDEARLLRVNAWYLNYFGRHATKQESNQALRRIRSGQAEQVILAGILSNQEFFNRTQSLVQSGFARDRFITGLYKLAVDPSATPSPALQRFLNQTWQTKGRTALILNVLQSIPVARNQLEGLSILINQAPAERKNTQVRLGVPIPTVAQALFLSRGRS